MPLDTDFKPKTYVDRLRADQAFETFYGLSTEQAEAIRLKLSNDKIRNNIRTLNDVLWIAESYTKQNEAERFVQELGIEVIKSLLIRAFHFYIEHNKRSPSNPGYVSQHWCEAFNKIIKYFNPENENIFLKKHFGPEFFQDLFEGVDHIESALNIVDVERRIQFINDCLGADFLIDNLHIKNFHFFLGALPLAQRANFLNNHPLGKEMLGQSSLNELCSIVREVEASHQLPVLRQHLEARLSRISDEEILFHIDSILSSLHNLEDQYVVATEVIDIQHFRRMKVSFSNCDRDNEDIYQSLVNIFSTLNYEDEIVNEILLPKVGNKVELFKKSASHSREDKTKLTNLAKLIENNLNFVKANLEDIYTLSILLKTFPKDARLAYFNNHFGLEYLEKLRGNFDSLFSFITTLHESGSSEPKEVFRSHFNKYRKIILNSITCGSALIELLEKMFQPDAKLVDFIKDIFEFGIPKNLIENDENKGHIISCILRFFSHDQNQVEDFFDNCIGILSIRENTQNLSQFCCLLANIGNQRQVQSYDLKEISNWGVISKNWTVNSVSDEQRATWITEKFCLEELKSIIKKTDFGSNQRVKLSTLASLFTSAFHPTLAEWLECDAKAFQPLEMKPLLAPELSSSFLHSTATKSFPDTVNLAEIRKQSTNVVNFCACIKRSVPLADRPEIYIQLGVSLFLKIIRNSGSGALAIEYNKMASDIFELLPVMSRKKVFDRLKLIQIGAIRISSENFKLLVSVFLPHERLSLFDSELLGQILRAHPHLIRLFPSQDRFLLIQKYCASRHPQTRRLLIPVDAFLSLAHTQKSQVINNSQCEIVQNSADPDPIKLLNQIPKRHRLNYYKKNKEPLSKQIKNQNQLVSLLTLLPINERYSEISGDLQKLFATFSTDHKKLKCIFDLLPKYDRSKLLSNLTVQQWQALPKPHETDQGVSGIQLGQSERLNLNQATFLERLISQCPDLLQLQTLKLLSSALNKHANKFKNALSEINTLVSSENHSENVIDSTINSDQIQQLFLTAFCIHQASAFIKEEKELRRQARIDYLITVAFDLLAKKDILTTVKDFLDTHSDKYSKLTIDALKASIYNSKRTNTALPIGLQINNLDFLLQLKAFAQKYF